MMRYHRSASFVRCMRDLTPPQAKRATIAMQRFVQAVETRQVPDGLGLKTFRHGYGEFRAGLAIRIVFHRSGDLITFVLVGDHQDIKRFLRRM
jgi:hypothetical protein